jgi:hypothetical protein
MSKKYRLSLANEAGEEVSFRVFNLGFDGFGHNGTHSYDEGYMMARKASEMYDDVAIKLGKWPIKKQTTLHPTGAA